MRIHSVDSVSFSRKPNAQEMKVYTRSLNEGLGLLGKQVDLIMHNASVPSVPKENYGIGSLFSTTTVKKLIPFLKNHAISNIQQEPNTLRKTGDNSPYAPESDAKNIFMIPLEKLTTEDYGKILSKNTFDKLVKDNPSSDTVDYDYIRKGFTIALKEAFSNSKNSEEFVNYKKQNEARLEKDAIFRVLSKENQEAGWENWNDIDKKLYVNSESQESKARIQELKEKYSEDYDYFLFQQMILDKENEKSNELAKKTGVKIVGDSPVAQTAVDEWAHQDLFLKDKAIGCPPDYFSPEGQRWGFRYYDPEKIFNKDGSLGEAGEVLKKKYEDYFASFTGGIRIDHVIGLVDPFIYTTTEKKMTAENSGRIYSIPNGRYQKSEDEYSNIFEKIILPAAKKFGIPKESIICEDLGDYNPHTQNVMRKFDLSGLAVTEFGYKGSETPSKNVIMLGSHDNMSFLEFVQEMFSKKDSDEFKSKVQYFMDYLAPSDKKGEFYNEVSSNKLKFIEAGFAELFASPARRVQIFFTDLFGIPKTYNRPGSRVGNWELRASENFEDDYYKAASEGTAPNFAKAILTALRVRGLDKGQEQLVKDLEASAKIIEE